MDGKPSIDIEESSLAASVPEENIKKEPPDAKESPKWEKSERRKRNPWKITLFINLVLISNLVTYYVLEAQHSTTVEKYEFAEAENKDLRLEINTLRKIIFLMNVDEQSPVTTTSPADPFVLSEEASEDVKIFDENHKKFICVDVKRFVDML